MNRPPRAIIFDMDGVLTDSEPLINAAAVAMFKEKGLHVQPADFLPFVGTGEDRYIGGVAEHYHFPIDLAAAKRRTYEIYLEMVPTRLEAFAGAVELVRACRAAGLLVAVASSADRVKIDANLRKIGLPGEDWNAVVSAEDARSKKPAPDLFLAAASRLGVGPGECVVVEDAVNGVEAARAAGMRCVAVAHTFPVEKLQRANLVRAKISELTIVDLVGDPLSTAQASQAAPAAPVSKSAETTGRPWGFWATIGFTVVAGLAVVGVQLAVVFLWALGNVALGHKPSAAAAVSDGLLISLSTICSAPVLLALVYLFIRLRKGMGVAEYLALQPVSGAVFLRWTMVLLLLVCASDWLSFRLRGELVPEFMREVYATARFRPLLWFALVVAAPVSEETLFRGFLFKGLLGTRLGGLGTIAVTAGCWAAIHLQYDAYGKGTILVLGLVLGYARLTTKSICTTLYMHGLMNLIATLEVALF